MCESNVETFIENTYDIQWNGMRLPINSELWDEWTLSRTLFDHPILNIPVRIMYVPDDEFQKIQSAELEKPKWWQLNKWIHYHWQLRKTRAVSYRGVIYIKQSAKDDRRLLLHELGHTVLFLEHNSLLRPGIMHPMFWLWMVNGDNLR